MVNNSSYKRCTLVVDDCSATRMLVRRTLEDLGFKVDEATQGQEALNCCAAHGPYDLAMVDWNMPVMNGLSLLTALSAKPNYQRMSILMISTRNELDEMLEAISLGATDYLTKPFSKDELREKLIELGFAL